MLAGTKLPVQQQGDCKLGETHAEICKVKLFLFSLGCRGGGKSFLRVTAAVGSRWERDGLCILVKLGTGVGNWVVRVGEYLLSKRKPPRRLRALTAVCCFGRACKSLLFFVGVSDALELVSSSIAGGHTEEIGTGNSEDCVLEIDRGSSSLVGFGDWVVLHLCVICWCTQSRQGDSINSDDRKSWAGIMAYMSALEFELLMEQVRADAAERDKAREKRRADRDKEWEKLKDEGDKIEEVKPDRKLREKYNFNSPRGEGYAAPGRQSNSTEKELRVVLAEKENMRHRLQEMETVNEMFKGELERVKTMLVEDYVSLSDHETVTDKLNSALTEAEEKAKEALSKYQSEQEVTGKLHKEIEVQRKELDGVQATIQAKFVPLSVMKEKESLLTQLREDMAMLQKLTKSDAASSEHSRKEYIVKIATLEKESKDREEKMDKIKAVAVKAKKELDKSRKDVVALTEEVGALKTERESVSVAMKDSIHRAVDYENLRLDYEGQTELLGKEREKLEGAERRIEELTKHLKTAIQQHEQCASEREDLIVQLDTLQKGVSQVEAQVCEMPKEGYAREKDLEVKELQGQLRKQKQQLQQTAQELEQLRKDAQQSSLMDMEMADYERLVKELNSKIVEKDTHIEDLETQLLTQKNKEENLNEEIESLKSQLDQGEEKSSKMKQLLVKTKKDLADAKKNEASQMLSQAALKGELEAYQQQLEDYKIQCSELAAERHRQQEQLRVAAEQHQRTGGSLQHRLNTLQEECSLAKAELAATTSEFESYKVRVHNVLRQQKNKSSAQNDGDVTKQEREHMESMLEQLQSKLKDSQQNLQASSAELQQLQTEHDTLLERHNKILQETVVKEAELRERLLSLQSENMALKAEHAQTVSQLSSQADTLRSSFREQLRHVQDEHRGTVDTLQQQISRVETQLFHLQKEPNASPLQQSKKMLQERKPTDLPLFELQSMAREEGEGMETAETESVSSAGTPLASLEQLLSSPDPRHEPFVWQVEPTKEELSQKLNTATRSMEHMNGLLHETEATNAILMEQTTLLKSEVRRLERNHEREKSVANLEYLKNVLLQFIFLHSGSERQALLPVIHTMLQLSPEEKSKLAAIAQGEEEADRSRGSGWSSYLHSWSGIR